MPDPDWWHALWPRPVEVLERLGIEPDAEVVDLCCGDGFFTIPLARMVRHVAAIDLDPAMLALARDRAFAEGLTNCTFTVGDAYDLANLVPGHVDSRVCSHLVSRTDWYQKTFASIRRGTIRFSSATGGHQPQWTGRLDHSGMSGSIGWELAFLNAWLCAKQFAFGALVATVAASCVSAGSLPTRRCRRRGSSTIGG